MERWNRSTNSLIKMLQYSMLISGHRPHSERSQHLWEPAVGIFGKISKRRLLQYLYDLDMVLFMVFMVLFMAYRRYALCSFWFPCVALCLVYWQEYVFGDWIWKWPGLFLGPKCLQAYGCLFWPAWGLALWGIHQLSSCNCFFSHNR